MRDGAAIVDAVVSLTGFSLVGGAACNNARTAETILPSLGVPYADRNILFSLRDSGQLTLPLDVGMTEGQAGDC